MIKKVGRPKKTMTTIETPPKITNGHLTAKDSKRTIVLTWGKYSITILCLTAVAIAVIQKINF